MYRTCIFCSADLGTNDSIAAFPVGRGVAFDAARGRLWAVCGRCARWNLAPLEERWEAVEEAERLFRDTRTRVQAENIGLCKLPDGTRLVRVGDAVAGELAAWRYGDSLIRRRRGYILGGIAVGAAGLVAVGGLLAMGLGSVTALWTSGLESWETRRARQVVQRLPAAQSPTGRMLEIRRWQVHEARLSAGDGGVGLHLPIADRLDGRVNLRDPGTLLLPPATAATVMNRAMVVVNRKGASRDRVADALGLLQAAGTAGDFLLAAAREERMLHGGAGRGAGTYRVGGLSYQAGPGGLPDPRAALALEMALHDETERRALDGELAALQEMWRQAEEIAAIADALPDGPVRPAHTPAIESMRG